MPLDDIKTSDHASARDNSLPIRTHAQLVVPTLHKDQSDAFPHYNSDSPKTRLRFCYQVFVGALQNNHANNCHVYKHDEGSELPGLKEALHVCMALPTTIRNK
jgi:hypothetical protein